MARKKWYNKETKQFKSIVTQDVTADIRELWKANFENTNQAVNYNAMEGSHILEKEFKAVGLKLSRSNALKIAFRLYNTQKSSIYIAALGKVLTQLNSDVINKEGEVNTSAQATFKKFIKDILAAKEDKEELQQLIQVNSLLHLFDWSDESTPAQDELQQGLEGYDVGKIERFYTKYRTAVATGRILSPQQLIERISEIGRYASAMAVYGVFNALGEFINFTDGRRVSYNSFPCCIGLVPIPHCKEIEVARSGKVLKFRATQSVFLANQEGGEDAIRVQFNLYGAEIIYLIYLWLLVWKSMGITKEIDVSSIDSPEKLRRIVDPTAINPATTKPTEEYRVTFPFISRNVIVPNCYIETLAYEDTIMNGMDCITISVLMRTYRRPKSFALHQRNDNIAFIGANPDTSLKMYKSIEFFANAAWRIGQSVVEIVDGHSWKVDTNSVFSDEVYYDVGYEQIASTCLLGLCGMM